MKWVQFFILKLLTRKKNNNNKIIKKPLNQTGVKILKDRKNYTFPL
jgi:hypothetical protein